MASTLELLNAAVLAIEQNPPLFTAVQSVAQSIPSATDTALTWPSPSNDTYVGWSSGTPTRWTPPVSGFYLVTVQVSFAINATGNRLGEIHKNGSVTASYQMSIPTTASGNNPTVSVSGIVQLNGTTDYVEGWAYQNSGGALLTTITQTSMSAYLIHR